MLWGTGIRSCVPGTLEGTLQWLVCLPALFWVLSTLASQPLPDLPYPIQGGVWT